MSVLRNERSQLANREKAMMILTAKLQQREEEEEAKKYAGERKSQIGTGDRSEKIRTYNFSQDRVTDHRIKNLGTICQNYGRRYYRYIIIDSIDSGVAGNEDED